MIYLGLLLLLGAAAQIMRGWQHVRHLTDLTRDLESRTPCDFRTMIRKGEQ